VTRAVLNGWPGTLEKWAEVDPKRFILAPMILNTDKHPVMSVPQLRTAIEQRRAGAAGEITSQYAGLDPRDPILEPYWALAESMDVPVMIHTGTSFPGNAGCRRRVTAVHAQHESPKRWSGRWESNPHGRCFRS
jgi:hypothetical protein